MRRMTLPKLDHPVDPLGMNCGILQTEARAKQSSLEQEKNQILDGLVVLVGLGPLSEVLNDAVVGVDLEVLLGCHVAHGGGVAESLGLHDPLHVGGPPVLGGDDAAGGADQTARHHHLLRLLVQDILHHLAQTLELLLVGLHLLLLLLILGQLQSFLGDGNQVLSVEFLELLDHVLVNGLGHVDNLQSPLLQSLNEGGGSHHFLALSSNVVDVLLVLLHPGHVVVERADVVSTGGGEVAEIPGQLLPVGGVLVDAQLEVLAELLVKFLEVVLVLGHLLNQLENLLHKVLPDDLEDLVLLKHFSGDVEGQILGVNHSLNEVEVLGNELLAVVHDEDPPHVQLDVVLALLVLEEIERCSLGDEEERSELQLTLHGEVLDSQMLLPVVGERFVELSVLLAGDVIGSPSPDGLGLVQLLILGVLLLDGLLFLLIFVLLILVFVLPNIFNLWFIVLLLLLTLLLFLFGLIVTDLLAPLLLDQQPDGVADEEKKEGEEEKKDDE